jgi:hypothetical protein
MQADCCLDCYSQQCTKQPSCCAVPAQGRCWILGDNPAHSGDSASAYGPVSQAAGCEQLAVLLHAAYIVYAWCNKGGTPTATTGGAVTVTVYTSTGWGIIAWQEGRAMLWSLLQVLRATLTP